MDGLENLLYTVRLDTPQCPLCRTLVQYLAVAFRLHHRQSMLLLIQTYLTRDAHASGQKVNQIVVNLVNLLTQRCQRSRKVNGIAYNQHRQDIIQYIRRHLLRCVTPGLVRLAVALHDQSIHTDIHRLLAQRGNQVPPSADMAGVAQYRQPGHTTVQLDGNLPHRHVAVQLFLVARETTVNSTHTLDTSLVYALQGTDPQFQVGIDRILDQYRDIYAFQRICQGLYGKGVGRCTGTHPQYVNTIFQSQFYVLGRCNLGSNKHASLFLYGSHPWQCYLAVALEPPRLCARLPNACTKNVTTFACQLHGSIHNLFLGFGTAWTCNYQRTYVVTGQIQRRKIQFHIVFLNL